MLIKLILSLLISVSCISAQKSLGKTSASRINRFSIYETWSELVCREGARRMSLPSLLYHSEYLIVLKFVFQLEIRDFKLQSSRILYILPGMLTPAQFSQLSAYLRFGVGNRFVSRS